MSDLDGRGREVSRRGAWRRDWLEGFVGEDRSMTVRDVAGGESCVKGHGGNSWLGDWAAVSFVCGGMALAGGTSESIQ